MPTSHRVGLDRRLGLAEKTLEQIVTDFAYANQDRFYTDEVNAELKHHGNDPISADDVQAILNGAPMQPAAEAAFAIAVGQLALPLQAGSGSSADL